MMRERIVAHLACVFERVDCMIQVLAVLGVGRENVKGIRDLLIKCASF